MNLSNSRLLPMLAAVLITVLMLAAVRAGFHGAAVNQPTHVLATATHD